MKRYIVVANSKQVACVLFLNTEHMFECQTMVQDLFKHKEWGEPRISQPISMGNAERIQLASNDDEVCQYLGIDTPEITFNSLNKLSSQ